MNKKTKVEKVVILAERNNGKFTKSEVFTLDKFDEYLQLVEKSIAWRYPNFNWLEKLLGKEKKFIQKYQSWRKIRNDMIVDIIDQLEFTIINDKKGKRLIK
ncbi:MAG: hypothetical protein EOL97_09475 [Spirochaetia bacterium]|nr:hypothetical protein [Spirochaetia bacterium]